VSIQLQGITWNHTRGFVPMVATAQRFEETHPGVEISWRKRSLQEFADMPLEKLAESFDFLVIDYPYVGAASAQGWLLPLDEFLPSDFLADQAAQSVGASHASYRIHGHQWGLATDAAAPTASWRPDLLDKLNVSPPHDWEELLELAKLGVVALPGVAVDSLVHFYMLCGAHGETPFTSANRVVSEEVGVSALTDLRALFSLCSRACLDRNPILTYEAMTSGDEIAYCPFGFCYSNYARAGFAGHLLRFGGLVEYRGASLRSWLGGAGLAVSRSSKHIDIAVQYARFVADPDCQRGLYFSSGGQPGYRGAWEDQEVNAACHNFFLDTLPTLDQTMLRPAYDGHVLFQDLAGQIVRNFLLESSDPKAALAAIEGLYRNGRS
jgi:multiple sugar transport system substrate-binding protein